MCKEQIFIPKMIEFNDKKRRRKSKFRNILRTLLSRTSDMDRQRLVYEPIKNSNLKRTIFILTALVAFVLGLSVGVLIPFVILPKINLTLNDTASNTLVYDYAVDNTIRVDSRPSDRNSSRSSHSFISSRNSSNGISNSGNHLLNLVLTNSSRQVNPYNSSKPFPSVSFVLETSVVGQQSPNQRINLSGSSLSSSLSTSDRGDSGSSLHGGLLDGIFWSDEMEARLPRGYDENDADRWRRFLRNAQVSKMEQGCGRMQNRLITFQDGE